jgi:hypothetical protein
MWSQEHFLSLVVGPCGALAVLVWWVASLKRSLRDSHQQNAKLSELLLRSTESHMRERLAREEHHMLVHDSTVRTTLNSLEGVLVQILSELRQ